MLLDKVHQQPLRLCDLASLERQVGEQPAGERLVGITSQDLVEQLCPFLGPAFLPKLDGLIALSFVADLVDPSQCGSGFILGQRCRGT